MSCGRILFSTVSKVFTLASYQVRHSDFDTAKFMSSLSSARYKILGERKKFKSSECFSVALDRGEVLYFSAFSAYDELRKGTPPFSSSAYCKSKNIALCTLSLFDKIQNPDDRRTFFEKEERLLAQISAFRSGARHMRFAALTRHGSISRALPEIEYILKCDAACTRAERLLFSYNELISVSGKY